MIFILITILLLGSYISLMGFYRHAWRSIPQVEPGKFTPATTQPLFSIIIPARNEEENIRICLDSLLKQSLPREYFEIWVVDDFSTDRTAEVVKTYDSGLVHLISLRDHVGEEKLNSYKKKAIETAIHYARGEWIVTTDADCSSPAKWLETLANYAGQQNSVFMAAPVVLVAPQKHTLVTKILYLFQGLDFMALQGITGASVYKQFHNMCNGANLAYRKTAFEEVRGFEGIISKASGDDMLLMQKIHSRHPDDLHFVKSRDAIVSTQSEETLSGFIHQRIRWASKADSYSDYKITLVLTLVYMFNAWLLLLALSAFFNPMAGWLLLASVVIKFMAELWFLIPVAGFFQKTKLLIWLLPFQPLHILYTLVAGWLGKFGHYRWKGRRVQ